jgi:tRNA nucleotidyltransferase/poly(A) polymerase
MAAGPTLDEVRAALAACLGSGERAWIVGGAVRDRLLGRVVHDVDVAVDGAAEAVGRRLADRLGGAVFTYSERFAAVRVVAGPLHVDLSPLRTAPGVDAEPAARAPASPESRLVADLTGRDFTVDAMAEPAAGGEVVDPLGGRDDLAAGRLRLCAPTALQDDPLRVLRLARLELELGLRPGADVLSAAAAAASGLKGVSGERIRDEFGAMLGLPSASGAVRRLAGLGALAVVLPELDRVRDVAQNPYHHHDVFEHTLEALDYVPGIVRQLGGERFLTSVEEVGLQGAGPLAPVAWAVLLHDIGKPVVRREENGRVMFWHHDEVGRGMALVVADRLHMSRRFAQFLSLLIRQHLRLGFLVREQPLTRRALARYRRDVSPYVFESVVVSLCDRVATRGDKTTMTSIARHFRLARDVWCEVAKAPVPRLLSGDDVIELLGIEPGPSIGQALDALEEEVEAGEVSTVGEARAFLRAWWAGRRLRSGEEA